MLSSLHPFVKPVVNRIEGTHTLIAFQKSSIISVVMLFWHLPTSLHGFRVHGTINDNTFGHSVYLKPMVNSIADSHTFSAF